MSSSKAVISIDQMIAIRIGALNAASTTACNQPGVSPEDVIRIASSYEGHLMQGLTTTDNPKYISGRISVI